MTERSVEFSRTWRKPSPAHIIQLIALFSLIPVAFISAFPSPFSAHYGCQKLSTTIPMPLTVTFADIGNYGQLGNQMFQVAAVIGTALRRGWTWEFPIRIAETEVGSLFSISGNLSAEDTSTAYTLYEKEPARFNNFELPTSTFFTQRLISLHGYFQFPVYFEEYNDIINSTFSFSSDRMQRIENAVPQILLPNTVGLHVRRGDYIDNPLYTNLGVRYYEKALKRLKKLKFDIVIITSNDIEWCKTHMAHLPYKLVFSPLNEAGDDLLLLARCKNLVLANSSFSWWAAYLNFLKFANGTVFVPRPWYRPSGAFYHLNSDEMYLPHWKVIDVDISDGTAVVY